MVKLWGKKAGHLDFSIGDNIAVTNEVVEHYRGQVAVSTTDETETKVTYCDNFFSYDQY